MKQYNLNKTVLVVDELPNGAKCFRQPYVNVGKGHYLLMYNINGKWKDIDIPDGFILLSIAKDITNEQAKKIMILIKRVYGRSYYDYTVKFKVGYGYVGTALESFHSWMQVENINSNSVILFKEN